MVQKVCANREEWVSVKETKEERLLVAAASTGKTSMIWQLLRFCLVGGTNTLIDVLILNLLLWSFPASNALILVVYNSVAYSGGAVTSFYLNKYWTFKQTQQITRRMVGRFAILLVSEILYSNSLLWLAGKMLQPLIPNPILWGNVAKLVAITGSALLSYLGMRFWAFARWSQDLPNQERTLSSRSLQQIKDPS